jgi:hypothetical protein
MPTHSRFSQNIKRNVQPFREELFASFCQIESTDTPQFDTQALQKNSKDVRHQNDEEQLEAVSSTGGDICGIITGIDICHRDLSKQSGGVSLKCWKFSIP